MTTGEEGLDSRALVKPNPLSPPAHVVKETTASLRIVDGRWIPVSAGHSDTGHWIVACRSSSAFIKVAMTPRAAAILRREHLVYSRISGRFIPEMLAWIDHHENPALVLENLSDACWPPPWTHSRIDAVLGSIAAMHATIASIPAHDAVHGRIIPGWQRVCKDPTSFLATKVRSAEWLYRMMAILLEQEALCDPAGTALTHRDLRSDNICLTHSGAVLVDWGEACASNPDLDLGFWLPSLALEGGPNPDIILPRRPEIAAYVAGHYAARAGLPAVGAQKRTRSLQLQLLPVALAWFERELNLC